MTFELYTKENLINAVLMTRRPVAFLVGSPMSIKDNVGVPGITTMLELVRAEILDHRPAALEAFEKHIRDKTGADAYQSAMNWLGRNAGQDAVNEVIANAVLKARKPGAPSLLAGSDGQPEDWIIPAGTNDLAALVARGGDTFLGPILTTNFDPLISLAIRDWGGRANRRVLVADGNLAGAAEDEQGVCSIIHLHGFWRESDTLNTQAQLTSLRPKLKASLQRLLVTQKRTLIVAAYGGWDDVFTTALIELMNDEQAQLDVIWCFRESDSDKVEQRYGNLLASMKHAIMLNRFRPFGGIDCHTIFAEIHSTLQKEKAPAVVASSTLSPLAGWQQIDSGYLNALPALSADEVVRYFDGAVPTWSHAVSPAIPRRKRVAQLTEDLAQVAQDNEPRSLRLIRAAGGEGKSTLLLQAAADIARDNSWSVLWRSSARDGLSADQIANLDPKHRWLIVADNADNIVQEIADFASQMSRTGRVGVHFLLAARDADWKNAGGDREPWAEWLRHFPDAFLRGINADDAKAVVSSWEQFGIDGLRELAAIGDPEQRVAAFESAVNDAEILGEQTQSPLLQDGSFFGGLLTVRFGQNGLQAHVRDFLMRLAEVKIEFSKNTLFDALLYVAACHGTGIPGIDERVLADLVKVPREWVQRLLVRPLGTEAVAVQNAGHVFTRHSKVAAAILVEAENSLGVDLSEVWTQLVRGTAETSKTDRLSNATHSKILHAASRLQLTLPPKISEARRKAIAIAVGKTAMAALPNRIDVIDSLSRAYRQARNFEAAAKLFRDNYQHISEKDDFEDKGRGFYSEWGVCEGGRGTSAQHALANAWLAGLALSDYLTLRLTLKDCAVICAGIGVPFGRLASSNPNSPYAKARRAVAILGKLASPDERASHNLETHVRESDKINTPIPANNQEAIEWLKTAVKQVGNELTDPLLTSLIGPRNISFNYLQNTLVKPEEISIGTRLEALRHRSNQFESQIEAGIQRVLTEAWLRVPADSLPEKRFHLAIQESKKIIARLSPQIRRPVGAYFDTHKWEPLKVNEPNAARSDVTTASVETAAEHAPPAEAQTLNNENGSGLDKDLQDVSGAES